MVIVISILVGLLFGSLVKAFTKYLNQRCAQFRNRKEHITPQLAGFTIIEVLIVLAIAGLIIAIVLIAVPNLQRSSRNTQNRAEASRLIASTNEFITNNDGKLPMASNSSTADSDAAKIFASADAKSITTLAILSNARGRQYRPQFPTFDRAIMVSGGVKCGTSGGVSHTLAAADAQGVVLIYALEDSDGNVSAQCIEN